MDTIFVDELTIGMNDNYDTDTFDNLISSEIKIQRMTK